MNVDKLEPLKPITAKQQDEFEHRRESASVVQTKCRACGAWYETAKRSTEFVEAFACDCGAPMSFTVPALTLEFILDLADGDQKLDTGMSVREAVASACYWWNKTGRHIVKKHGINGDDAFASLDPSSMNFMPSGIINGEPWDILNKRERVQLVKAWHHFFVRKPQTL